MEVLVTLAILAVLLGLLIPAIQNARVMAARVECSDRLKQIGLALHHYHTNHGFLPPGISKKLEKGAYPYLSWNVRILPFLEQAVLWKEIQNAFHFEPNFLKVPPHTHRKTVVKAFTCPLDRLAAFGKTIGNQDVAFTTFLGVEGTDQIKQDGLLFLDSQIQLQNIKDGTSHTLLVGERPPPANSIFGWWYAGWGQNHDGSGEMVLGAREINQSFAYCPSGPSFYQQGSEGDCHTLHFWSWHSGGANFLFADGAARFLSYASANLMPSLATRAGGEITGADW